MTIIIVIINHVIVIVISTTTTTTTIVMIMIIIPTIIIILRTNHIMTSLSPRTYFLTSQENIIAVGIERIDGRGHGIKGTYFGRISIQHKDIRAIALANNSTENEFLRGAEIFLIISLRKRE